MDKVAEIFESIVPILAAKARICMEVYKKVYNLLVADSLVSSDFNQLH